MTRVVELKDGRILVFECEGMFKYEDGWFEFSDENSDPVAWVRVSDVSMIYPGSGSNLEKMYGKQA